MLKNKKTAVALGYFDGLHKGHMPVISKVIESSKLGFVPSILLFDEHPQKYLRGIDVPAIITDSDRDIILSDMGLEINTESFGEICKLSPRDFVNEILIKKYNVGFISCGFNYTFGYMGQGDVSLLKEICGDYGIILEVCDEETVNGISVSSTEIRNAINNGRVEEASLLLGRNFTFESDVFSGDHRGRKLGFPTINQYLPEGLIIPSFGVYAVYVSFDGNKFPGVANIGNRPTFDGNSVRCETYILGFDGDLYNKVIRIELIEYLRAEKKFDSVSQLVDEISANAEYVKSKYMR